LAIPVMSRDGGANTDDLGDPGFTLLFSVAVLARHASTGQQVDRHDRGITRWDDALKNAR
jgi:hypothetical protein